MRKIWPMHPIGSLCTKATVGFVGSMSDLFVEAGIPLLRGQNIKPGRIQLENLKYISESTHRKWSKSALFPGDVVLVRVGYPGTAAVVPEGLGPLNAASLVILRPNGTKLLSRYLMYLLNSPWGQATIRGRLVGVAQQVLNTQTAADLEIPVPPLEIQRRISVVLSAYDDLIEVNTRRIKALEEMARRTYEEWFVHYRHPGGDGMRPDGWGTGTLDDVVVFQRGFDLPRRDRTDGPHPIISASGVSGSHVEFKVKAPGLVTGRSGTLGEVMLAWDDFWPLNTTLWAKAFPMGSLFFAYYTLLQIDLVGFNAGAAVPTLNRNDISGLPVEIPDKETLSRFEKIANSYHRLAKRLGDQNANLRTQRDLLLPRLVSGVIDVSEAEAALHEPVEVAAE